MEKLKQYKYIVLIALVILGSTFYWFQIRPAQARKECIETYPYAFGDSSPGYQAMEGLKTVSDKAGYQKCLREHGLSN